MGGPWDITPNKKNMEMPELVGANGNEMNFQSFGASQKDPKGTLFFAKNEYFFIGKFK